MCITEYDEKTFVDGIRAEGRAEGRANERLEAIKNMIEVNVPKEEIIKRYSVEEYDAVMQNLSSK